MGKRKTRLPVIVFIYPQGMGSFIGFVQDLILDATLDAQEV